MFKSIWCLLALLLSGVSDLYAQQPYSSLTDALQSSWFSLRGKSGPEDVNWIDGGTRYSYKDGTDIHVFDPKTLEDKTVFSVSGLHFPGTARAFTYESFEWSHDSKHLLFRTNFRHLFRRSGISDYYIYDVTTRELQQAARDARSAELSPDGSSVGMERNGNLFVYRFASGSEQPLTNDSTSETGTFNGHYDW